MTRLPRFCNNSSSNNECFAYLECGRAWFGGTAHDQAASTISVTDLVRIKLPRSWAAGRHLSQGPTYLSTFAD